MSKSNFKVVDTLTPAIQVVNVTGGLRPRGAFSDSLTYSIGDAVSYNGSSYILYNLAVAGTLPTDTSYWMVLANGVSL